VGLRYLTSRSRKLQPLLAPWRGKAARTARKGTHPKECLSSTLSYGCLSLLGRLDIRVLAKPESYAGRMGSSCSRPNLRFANSSGLPLAFDRADS
jgi:hypothetical protein